MKTVFVVFLFAFTSIVIAAEEDELLIKDLEKSLMAPCCWSGTVADHGHEQMETEIRRLVAEGKTKNEIINYFVGIYGERILATPIAEGFNLMVWLVPLAILLIATIVLISYIKTRSEKEIIPATVPENEKVQYNDIIEKELKEME